MFNTTELDLHIRQEILIPMLNESSIKAQANSLGFTASINHNQATELYNTLFNNVIEKLRNFGESEKAKSLCPQIKHFDLGAIHKANVRRILTENIEKIYNVTLFPIPSEKSISQTLSSFLGSLLAYLG